MMNKVLFTRAVTYFNIIAYTFVISLLLNLTVPVSEAVWEGTANANMMIRRYERKGQFGKAALWRQAAAECLNVISIPLIQTILKYSQKHNNMELAQKARAELKDTEARRQEHLRLAKLNWEKAKESKEELDSERAKIDKFISEWVPHYPDRFYQFGTYVNVFGKRVESLKNEGKFGDALILEAEAADMAAEQYTVVTIAYFNRKAEDAEKEGNKKLAEQYRTQATLYQEFRDNHLRRAAMLRALAKQNPKSWPQQADERDFNVPQSHRKLTAEEAIKAARSDKRTQEFLKGRKRVQEFAWFQGFCWTVSYYTRDWGNLGIVFVDDETGKVTDVLTSPGNLEELEGDEGKREERKNSGELKLTPEQVTQIAVKNEQAAIFLKKHPNTKTNANFNWRYNCWIVEFIVGDREVGAVTVSDETGKVLEVTVGHPE